MTFRTIVCSVDCVLVSESFGFWHGVTVSDPDLASIFLGLVTRLSIPLTSITTAMVEESLRSSV